MGETRVIRVDADAFDSAELTPAVEAIERGGLVGIPTETVYGIAVNLERPEARRRLLEARGSAGDKPVTVHIGDRDDLRRVVTGAIPATARRLIQRFWPGPLTIVFPSADGAGLGVRFPRHRVACEILRRTRARVGVPSANLSGRPPAVTAEEALEALGGKLDVLVDAGPTRHRGASTVVRVNDVRIDVLREGAIPRAMVEEVNVVTVLFVCTGNTCRSPMAAAMFRRMLAERRGVREEELEGAGYRVASAGTAAGHGGAATEEAERAVKELGADLSGHSSQPVSVAMLEDADRVYVMTGRHKRILEEWMPDHAGKIQLLDPAGGEVLDPVGGSLEVYRNSARRIRECLEQRLKEIA